MISVEQMHLTFRELGQRMGMQTVRAIYPEDIDICLNFAIIDIVKNVISTNISVPNDLIIKANTDISQLNALRTLSKKENILISSTGNGSELNPYIVDITNDKVMYYTHFAISYDGNELNDCRIIEAEYLQKTIKDYCNRPTKKHPICVSLDIDGKINIEIYTGSNKVKPTVLVYNYIKLPNKVKLDTDIPVNSINCDLPDYLTNDIIKLALQYYINSFGNSNEQKTN